MNTTTSQEVAAVTTKTVFHAFSGSWFVDWNKDRNFMRSVLANDGFGLTSQWNWDDDMDQGLRMQHMALGQTIGFAHNVSQGDFDGSGRVPTYKDLLGDPTLRMHILKPVPTAPQVVNNGNGVTISWSAAPGAGEDGFQGYYVYRAASASDPFERITPNLVTGPERSVDDPEGVTGNVYMVRAVKLETTPSGTYFNASQGAFSAPVP